MDFSTDLNELKIVRSWCTVGSFDGVHLGHQALIRQLIQGAHAENSEAIVLTFSPHPAVFFGRSMPGYSLSTPEERERLLKELGVDRVVTIKFDQTIANLSAADFMRGLKDHLGLIHFLAGYDFALGRDREGNFESLQAIGKQMGFAVEAFAPVTSALGIISSSRIRDLLHRGKLSEANQLLGRPYSLEGAVINGEHRGRKLGFPTANLDIAADRLVPAKGVYACRALVNNQEYTAVTNIGVRPTFENPLPVPRVEPHLLDLQEDLYGHILKLELIEYLRPEKVFNTPEELIAQVKRDIEKTREVIPHGE
ncbi:MAG: bifunctional riboflavin kinase/FAD synthetase [Anaerolineaceae bacterium]|nr:bifunctional riboflavin kinase/FAD synthetase [Anaerolineaceae bacterium]